MNGYGSVPTSRPVPQTPYAMGSYGMMYAPPTSSGLANNAYHLYEQAQVSQAETMSTTGSDHSTHSSYNCNPTTSRFQNLRTSSFAPTGTAHQPVYPGTHVHHYDTSPETSSHSDSAEHHYADPQYQPVNQPLVSQWTATADQASQLKDELSRKQQRINELQHEVEAADLHRRQVQTRNFELEAMLQGHSGHQVAVDTTHMHALTAENAVLSAGLQARIVQLTQQLSQGSGLARSHNLELQQKVLSLNATVSQLMSQLYTAQRAAQAPPQQAQHESQHTQRDAEVESQIQLREAQLEQEFKDMVGQMESEHEQRLLELKTQHGTEVDELQKQLDDSEDSKIKLRQEHDQQLDVLRDDHADQLLDVKTDHANLMDQLTKQKEKVEATLSESQSTSKEAADKHSVVVQQLTDQIQQLEASLNTARSQSTAVQQQQPELKLLQQQKQRLENDLKEAHNANRVVENKLEEADLQLADAEDKLSEAEQKLKQAEKQASKAAKTIRANEKQLSQLHDQTATLKDEIQDLKDSAEGKSLTEENSRLLRESKLARDRFDKMQREMRDLQHEKRYLQTEDISLQDRLTQYALQAPDEEADAHSGPVSPSTVGGRPARGQAVPRRQASTPQDELIAELKEVQLAEGVAPDSVTLASIARDRRHASASAAASSSSAADVVIPKVDFGRRPKYFGHKSQDSRRSRDTDDFRRPGFEASPAVDLPSPSARLQSPVVNISSPLASSSSPAVRLQSPVLELPTQEVSLADTSRPQM